MVFVAVVAVMMTVPKIQDRAEAGEKIRISYTVVFYNVDEAVFDKISSGQNVTEAEDGISLGYVFGVPSSEPSYSYVLPEGVDAENAVVEKSEDALGRKNITVTVEAEAVYSEGSGYTVDGYRIAVGKEMNLRFPNYTAIGYCTDLTVFKD